MFINSVIIFFIYVYRTFISNIYILDILIHRNTKPTVESKRTFDRQNTTAV